MTRNGSNRARSDGMNFHTDWTPADKTAAIHKVKLLEDRLFDNEGHLDQGIPKERACQLLNEINALRHNLGWLNLDLEHHLVWPDESWN